MSNEQQSNSGTEEMELSKIAEWYCSHEITAACYNGYERNE